MKGLLMMDENISNLTSASGGDQVSATSGSGTMYPQHQQQQQQHSYDSTNQEPPPQQQKRKRNLPGHPDPDAEVIALSPNSLLATNRFICEICSKGFKRDQNLQLHRRGHNLPWKLKQRSNKDVIKKKVYVCPETSCVHHDASRALGDLTGIKKHFCRKHGDKKWKCEKCSKKYAVQSDWKAHSKICGTREYRCDCGTLFSRRDSFITHRAFCDALAEEGARSQANPFLSPHHNQQEQQASSTNSHMMMMMNNFQTHNPNLQNLSFVKREQQDHHLLKTTTTTTSNNNDHFQNIPQWLSCPPPPTLGGPTSTHHHHVDHHLSSSSPLFSSSSSLDNPNFHALLQQQQPPPHMSATALLQKAAQMGVSPMSTNNNSSTSHAQGHGQGQGQGQVVMLPPGGMFRGLTTQQHHQAQAQAQAHAQAHQMGDMQGAGAADQATVAAGPSTASFGLSLSSSEQIASGFVNGLASFGNKAAAAAAAVVSSVAVAAVTSGLIEQVAGGGGGETGGGGVVHPSLDFHDMMSSFSSPSGFDGSTSSFDEAFNGIRDQSGFLDNKFPETGGGGGGGGGGGNDGYTRDFLGLKPFSHRDFLNMAAGFDHMNPSSTYNEHQTQNHQTPWQG